MVKLRQRSSRCWQRSIHRFTQEDHILGAPSYVKIWILRYNIRYCSSLSLAGMEAGSVIKFQQSRLPCRRGFQDDETNQFDCS
jgi:hypothetical protein